MLEMCNHCQHCIFVNASCCRVMTLSEANGFIIKTGTCPKYEAEPFVDVLPFGVPDLFEDW